MKFFCQWAMSVWTCPLLSFSLLLFFSGFEFWLFQLQIRLSICHNRCRSYEAASFPYSSNREIASGVGNMSGIRFVLSSRELGLCSPPALQELCMHCCSEVVAFSRESCWVLDEAKMEWFRVGKNRWSLFFNSILQKLNLFQNWTLSNRSFWFSFLILLD